MAEFDRKSMESIVQSMVDWTRGVTTKLTDFRVGSKIRTLQESVALVVEELYDKVYRNTKALIAENAYSVMGFSKRQATYATGKITFSRNTPADTDYLISAGAIVKTKATESTPPIQYRTTTDVLLAKFATSVDVVVVCLTPGKIGNVEAGSISDFVTKPSGVENVTNAAAFSNALDIETPDEQKVRFQKFIQSLSRGTLSSIEYGATTAQILDAFGLPIERVTSARAFEYLPSRKGEVDLYVWNGASAASADLLTQVQKVIYGYYNDKGEPVYGYKPAGVIVYTYSATIKSVTIKVVVTPETGILLTSLQGFILQEVNEYFSSLQLGQTLIQTALETRIKLIPGVMDVKLSLSTDGGTTFTQNNITAGPTEILLAVKPIQYG